MGNKSKTKYTSSGRNKAGNLTLANRRAGGVFGNSDSRWQTVRYERRLKDGRRVIETAIIK